MIQAGARYRIILVTCASIAEARRIAQHVVEMKRAACAKMLPGINSIYRWKGKVERASEVLLLMKTTATCLRQLEKEVKRLHSYEVPEFVVLLIVAGTREYLDWLGKSVR